MHFPFFIARRYLISKKSHNIINLISGVSMVGVATGTAALIIVLSVFNGFETLVKSLFSVFDPDLKITAIHGKSFSDTAFDANAIKKLEGVINYTDVVEENALLRYNQQQYLATIKGVDSLYQKNSPVDTLLVNGEMILQDGDLDFAIPGYGVAYFLGLDMNDPKCYISVYIPKRTGNTSGLPNDAFNSELIKPMGIFSVQQDFDDKYMLVPLRFARRLLDYTNEVTSVEIRLSKNADNQGVKQKSRRLQVRNSKSGHVSSNRNCFIKS